MSVFQISISLDEESDRIPPTQSAFDFITLFFFYYLHTIFIDFFNAST